MRVIASLAELSRNRVTKVIFSRKIDAENLLDALRLRFEPDQRFKDCEDVAAVFDDPREDVAQFGDAFRLTMPFREHLGRDGDIAAQIFRTVSAQKEPVEEGRFALGVF